jgi:hypothetical protein
MILVFITRDRLVELGACPGGLALFDSVAALHGNPDAITIEWTPLAEVWFSLTRFAAWARERGVIPRVSLAYADLSGANLSGADLCGADLYGAYLGGAYLRGAYLRGANLCGADLCGADLCRANLRVADLSGSKLSVADLSFAYLGGANLSGANLGNWERGPDGFARRVER